MIYIHIAITIDLCVWLDFSQVGDIHLLHHFPAELFIPMRPSSPNPSNALTPKITTRRGGGGGGKLPHRKLFTHLAEDGQFEQMYRPGLSQPP